MDEKGYERTGEAIAGSSDADDVRQARDYRDGMVYDIAKVSFAVRSPVNLHVELNFRSGFTLLLPLNPRSIERIATNAACKSPAIVLCECCSSCRPWTRRR